MFSRINFIGAFILIFKLVLATDTGNQKNEIFYNCNNYQENDSFDLRVPEGCNMTENISWHLELKNIVRFHRNNRTCSREIKIVFVSKDHVMVPTQDSEGNNDYLLLDYLDGNFKHQTPCVSGDVKVHRFNYDIYIDVMRDNYWSDKITIHEAFEKSFLEFVVGDDYKHLSDKALLAAIQAFLLAKSLNGKHNLKEYYSVKQESMGFFGKIKSFFNSKESKKYVSYQNLENYFKEMTNFEITNDEKIIRQGSEIIRNRIQEMAKLNYKESCRRKNEKQRIFSENGTPNQIIRKYLDRKDIIAEEIEYKEVYLIHVCKQEKPKEIHSDFKLDEICYEKMPVVLNDGSLMFADRKNYLSHYSSKRSCSSLFSMKNLKSPYHKVEMDLYDSTTNALMERISFLFTRLSTGWFGHALQKYKFYFCIGAVFIIIFGTITLLAVCYVYLKPLGTDRILEEVGYLFRIFLSILLFFLWVLLKVLTLFLPCLNEKAHTFAKTISDLRKRKEKYNPNTMELGYFV